MLRKVLFSTTACSALILSLPVAADVEFWFIRHAETEAYIILASLRLFQMVIS